MHDVVIVGGGPGGLYAARQLARHGFDVSVFEEHPEAGDPVHCTGVLALEAFGDFEIPRDVILNDLRTARFFGPSGASIEYSTPEVEAVVIDRRRFDDALCESARTAGAIISTGVRITDIRVTDTGVDMTSSNGDTTRARACVLACGANYMLQRRLGLGMPAHYLQSAQLEVPAGTPGDVELHFGGVAPRGFAWAVPVRRGTGTFARVGLMCERDPREHFDRFLARIAARWDIDSAECLDGRVSPRTKVLPLAPIARTYTTRLLAVGDAAGLVKATTGGGIYYSLLSGRLAAETLEAGLCDDSLGADALASYEQRWRALLGEELSAQMTLRTIADDLSEGEIEQLFELARVDGIMPIVRRTATFNRHRALILSLLAHAPARSIFMRGVLGWAARRPSTAS